MPSRSGWHCCGAVCVFPDNQQSPVSKRREGVRGGSAGHDQWVTPSHPSTPTSPQAPHATPKAPPISATTTCRRQSNNKWKPGMFLLVVLSSQPQPHRLCSIWHKAIPTQNVESPARFSFALHLSINQGKSDPKNLEIHPMKNQHWGKEAWNSTEN